MSEHDLRLGGGGRLDCRGCPRVDFNQRCHSAGAPSFPVSLAGRPEHPVAADKARRGPPVPGLSEARRRRLTIDFIEQCLELGKAITEMNLQEIDCRARRSGSFTLAAPPVVAVLLTLQQRRPKLPQGPSRALCLKAA